ncbi:hypothetical protein ABT023_02925 [Micromonospora sp. NPDC002296]|uniref:hypothetical protein n=1 Tax=Micromonospora sp. NPDC002296 TaxID=3154271 RepID=UPI0033332457
MNGVSGLVLPSYYLYYESPVKIVPTPEGGARVWRLSMDSGGWQESDRLFEKIVFAVGGDVFKRSPEEFVQDVEEYRGHYLSGEGPVFALYETVKAVIDTEVRENRYLTDRETALVRGIRRKTFVMFEEQLRRAGHPGADPSIGQ